MALTIQTEKGIFDLPRDFSVEIENTSPIYTDKGSQTIASTLPATGHNLSMVVTSTGRISAMLQSGTPRRW